MELIEAIKARRSIRKFKSDPVSDQEIKALLEAARLAPSGVNMQPWRFVVIKSDQGRERLNEATWLPFVAKAPVVLACCVDKQSYGTLGNRITELREAGAFLGTPLENMTSEEYAKNRKRDQAAIDAYMALNAAIAIDHITLRAVDLGLATCWVMMFDQDKIKLALDLDDKYHVVALIPVGYPDQDPAPRPRLPLDELIIKEL